MRYAVFGKCKDGVDRNVFKDGRTFSHKNSAIRNMDQMQVICEETLFIKELEDPVMMITDTPFMVENITIDQHYQFENEIQSLKSRIEELEKDRVRLDWMMNNRLIYNSRERIDAAMESEMK